MKHANALADVAADIRQPRNKRVEAQKALLAKKTAAATPPEIPPRAMIPAESDDPGDESIRVAGQFDQLGEKVPRGFLRVVGDVASESSYKISPGRSGRLELGGWLTDTETGAGRLAARVLANRIWHHLLGRGLVRTVDNFGRTGEVPTHPELLDYLARELIDSGWSIKSLVRQIVLSRTFRMSSEHDEAGHLIDPENRWLWRAHRQRLDPESIRDSMLLAAGELDLAPRDSTVWYLGDQATAVGADKNRRRTDFLCRSVYLPVIRNDLPELFDVFDFANPHATTGMRPQTMVATQGLFLLNDESVLAAAKATAQRLLAGKAAGGEASVVEPMYELVLNAKPTDAERDEILAFVNEMQKQFSEEGDANATLNAWSSACHALFASSRFQILE